MDHRAEQNLRNRKIKKPGPGTANFYGPTRLTTTPWREREFRFIAISACAGCKICRASRGSERAGTGHLFSFSGPKACGAATLSKSRARGRSTRKNISTKSSTCGRRPRYDGRLGRRGSEETTFEWQKGSIFAIPMNATHRIVNATSSPALLFAGTTAPNVMNNFDNEDFIFNCPYQFKDRFDPSDDYYKYKEEVTPDPLRGLAMRKTNIIPDVMGCELPMDNRRSPGYRRIEPHMAGQQFYLWIGQHETGRYSKAHAHGSAAVLICLSGKGYTYTWPSKLGTHPWEKGTAEKIRRQDYEPVGMVSAAPMSGNWFHAHFGASKEPLRLTAWFGPNAPGRDRGKPGEKGIDYGAIDMKDGGTAVPYNEEDPYLRKEFEETLASVGANRAWSRIFTNTPTKNLLTSRGERL